jgi:hypothetical protein
MLQYKILKSIQNLRVRRLTGTIIEQDHFEVLVSLRFKGFQAALQILFALPK